MGDSMRETVLEFCLETIEDETTMYVRIGDLQVAIPDGRHERQLRRLYRDHAVSSHAAGPDGHACDKIAYVDGMVTVTA